MRIGVIGSGRLGGMLGQAWGAMDHEVLFASRDPTQGRVVDLAVATPGARTATLEEAHAASDVLLLAVPGNVAEMLARNLDGWSGKVLIDPTNHLAPDGSSNAEAIQRAAPGARVVKAFNVMGVEALERAATGNATGTMPIAGNDEEAIAIVSRLVNDVGLTPLHVGGLAMATSLEQLSSVWIAWSRTLGRRFLWDVVR